MQIQPSGAQANTRGTRSVPYDTTQAGNYQIVAYSDQAELSTTGTESGWESTVVFDDLGAFVAAAGVTSTGFFFVQTATGTSNSSTSVTRGSINNYELDVNFGTGTAMGFLNGSLITS